MKKIIFGVLAMCLLTLAGTGISKCQTPHTTIAVSIGANTQKWIVSTDIDTIDYEILVFSNETGYLVQKIEEHAQNGSFTHDQIMGLDPGEYTISVFASNGLNYLTDMGQVKMRKN